MKYIHLKVEESDKDEETKFPLFCRICHIWISRTGGPKDTICVECCNILTHPESKFFEKIQDLVISNRYPKT